MQKERIYYLDVIRAIACVMIVLMHSPLPDTGIPGFVQCPISLFTAPAIGLFFMVSGALLLPVKEDGIAFIRKRLMKIVWPVVIWTFFAIMLNAIVRRGFPIRDFGRMVISIPFSVQGCGVFWFVYVLVGLYILAPIISPWLEKVSRKELLLFLILWTVTMCYPILNKFVQIEDSKNGLLYYFSGYIGYFVLGYYLHKFGKGKNVVALLLMPIPFVAVSACKLAKIEVDFYSVFWYLSVFVAMMCWGWFTLVRNNAYKINGNRFVRKFVVHFSNCSFGIYLIHFFVMRYFLWRVCDIAVLGKWSLIVSFVGTLVISYGVVTLISYLPFSEYIIGYRKR